MNNVHKTKENKMNKIGKLLIGLGGIIITGSIGIYLAYLIYKELHFISTDAAFLQADIIDVSPTAIGGKIEKLYFNEFQKIKKGDLLAVLDNKLLDYDLKALDYQIKALEDKKRALEKDYKASLNITLRLIEIDKEKLKQAKSNLEKAKLAYNLTLANYKTTLNIAKNNLKIQENRLKAIKSKLEKIERDYKRFLYLYEQGVISLDKLEKIKVHLDAIKAEYLAGKYTLKIAKEKLNQAKSLKNKVEIAKQNLNQAVIAYIQAKKLLEIDKEKLKKIYALKDQIKALNKNILSLKEKKEKLKESINRTYIYAPINGVIAKKWRDEGEVVSVGMPIYSIYDPKKAYVIAYIDETNVPYIKKGKIAKVHLDTCNLDVYGKVESVGAYAGDAFSLIPNEPTSGEFVKTTVRVPVKIILPPISVDCLKVGSSAQVEIRKD